MTYPAEPTHTPLGERLRDRTAPLAPSDADYGFAHAYLCEALSKPLLEVQEVFDPEGDVPPVAPLLDPFLCPAFALPWLAQLIGLTLPPGTPEATARQLIYDAGGFRRGTVQSIRAVASYYLTGSQSVQFRERDGGDPYALEVVTLTSETADPVATEKAIARAIPGGIVFRFRTITSWDYQQMTAVGGTYSAQSAQYLTYQKLTENVKG